MFEMVSSVDPTLPSTYKKKSLKDGDHIVQNVSGEVKTCILTKLNRNGKRRSEDDEGPPTKVIIVTNPRKITRDKYSNVLYSREENKQYRIVYDKRVIQPDLDTLPYGF